MEVTPANPSQRVRMLFLAAVVVGVALPVSGTAQTATGLESGPNPAAPAASPSISHAAAKGLTLKIGSALKKFLIFSVGTGAVATGGALTVLTTASSYAIYVTNEYFWDRYDPTTQSAADNRSFDTSASFWRNTKKYLTLKPIGMAATWGLIYAYTGSWTTTVAMGSVSSLAGPLVFYANNVGWDWYDWYSGKANPQTTPSVPHREMRQPRIADGRSRGLSFLRPVANSQASLVSSNLAADAR